LTVAVALGLSVPDILRDLGYAGLVLLMLAETVFPPIPSEAVLPLAGYLVGRGDLHIVPVLLTSTAGSVTGALLLYEASRLGGRPFVDRFLRVARLSPARLHQAELWFERRGALVVTAGRCVPGVRSLVSLPAGLLRMSRGRYLLFTLIGSALWNSVLVGAGWVLGSQWETVSGVIGPLSRPLLAGAVLATVAWLVWRATRSRSAASSRSRA